MQASWQLQTAVDDSHPAPPAMYLRQAAAACLTDGLHFEASALKLKPVNLPRAIAKIMSASPDIQGLTQKLQKSKYFTISKHANQPDMLLVDLHTLIMPQQQIAVASLLAMIGRRQSLVPSSNVNPDPAMHPDAHTMVRLCCTRVPD